MVVSACYTAAMPRPSDLNPALAASIIMTKVTDILGLASFLDIATLLASLLEAAPA